VSRSFGALRAVDGVTLSVGRGARHALIGPNGAGKSTLLRLIAGGLQVNGGRIHLDDVEVTRTHEARRAQLGIGQTFQQSSLFRGQTVAENVALAVQRRRGRPWLPVPHRPAWAGRVDELLARVGLDDRAGDRVDALSHAECRQLEVAVALATEPRVLLLDEPAAGMSAASTRHL
jgi:branched-chain amino acid transport system ATP-binding protein